MSDLRKKEGKKIKKELNKNLSLIYSKFDLILKKQKEGNQINEKDYIWLVFSSDIYYRIKDITFLNKKLKETKNNFDSSLHVLSRSVLETFIYFKYLLCDESKIMYRLRAFACHSTKNNELKTLKALRDLEIRGKFIYDNDPNHILSDKMMSDKINEFNKFITDNKNIYKEDPLFEFEINIFEKVIKVAEKYDEINDIDSVISGSENKSLEWMYHYVYRFQSMSIHQSLRDKEKIFNSFDKNKEPDNIHVLALLNDITEQILTL